VSSTAARRDLRLPAVLALGLAAGAGVFLLLREPSVELTAERLAAAERRWAERGPRDYRLEIEVRGAAAARHVVVVRDGSVTGMTTGGYAAAPSAWPYWSVEGLFRFLGTELENARRPGPAYGVEAGSVVARVRFDAATGYPVFFLRHVMGARRGVEWRARLHPGPGFDREARPR